MPGTLPAIRHRFRERTIGQVVFRELTEQADSLSIRAGLALLFDIAATAHDAASVGLVVDFGTESRPRALAISARRAERFAFAWCRSSRMRARSAALSASR